MKATEDLRARRKSKYKVKNYKVINKLNIFSNFYRLKHANNILMPIYYLFLILDAFLKRFWINRYPHLHKIDRIFINVKTRHIEMLVDEKYVHPVKFSLKRLDLEKILIGQILKVETQIFNDVLQVLDT